ncbi:YhhN-like [Trinorchestia longiramus]|nr:YhhN-like [Trinorchestia longiramus]
MSVLGEYLELRVSVLCSAIAVLYLALWQEPSLLAIFVKILPCVFLFLYLGKKHLEDKQWRGEVSSLETMLRLFGISSSTSQEQRSAKSKKESGSKGSQRKALKRRQLREGVAMGLLWSLIGDVFLIWINVDVMFVLGMLAFEVAQLSYIRGLGFSSLKKLRGAVLYTVLVCVTVLVLQEASLPFKLTVPLYSATLTTTLWRAADRYEEDDGRSTMQKSCSVLGALTFVISDTCIALSKFVMDVDPMVASAVIHVTYYLAQTLLTLGAI